MQFKQYPSYKDSGVEWLGEVPEHWRISSLKRYGYFKGGAGFPHAYQGNTEENIPFFKVNSLSKDKRFLSSFSDFVGEETAKKLGAKIFPKNSIFFAKVGAALLLERIRTNQQPCCIDNNMMGFVIQNELSFDFAFYLMSLIDFKYLVNPGAVPSINESQISSFLISVPPISEQTQIANYLDTETARIDNLISKQEKLIELLEEQRKSIISHAVTKGLNPNAPMKDSGVEWLGKVPEHWNLKPIKFLAKTNQLTLAENTDENYEIQYVDIGSVSRTNGIEKIETILFKDAPSRARRIVKDGDIIVSTVRTYLKAIAYIENPPKNLIVSTGFAVLNPIRTVIFPQYAKFTFLAEQFIAEVIAKSKGISYPAITATELADIKIALPPLNEQKVILQYLLEENLKMNKLISKQNQLIEKLKEYRASIISHAVTGKIDVREFGA